ncbi:MAG: ABC transporter permease [bacterium]|nr:ABC transporter permease [bacterium]
MMFFKLSVKNIKQSLQNYTIYFITLIIGVAIFYTFNSMGSQTAVLKLSKSSRDIVKQIIQLMSVVSVIVSIILGYLIIYANNFLIRRRKKEFGLYQTLGMSKRKIAQLLLAETILIGIISLIVGLFVGTFLSQGMSLLVIRMFQADLSQFAFSFSASAAVKSCIYFGGIYILVMIFNVITVSRYKLINLLNASKRNEVLKVKSNIVSVILFIASIICIGTAYYMLRVDHVLFTDLTKTVVMLVLGAVGTYLFFSSLAGFLLKLVQLRKSTYYKNLNMFVLRQVNSRINTMKISMTIISLMLLLTIGIMSSALSLVSAMNGDVNENNLCDFTLIGYDNKNTDILGTMKKDGVDYTKYVSETLQIPYYRTTNKEMDTKEYIGDETAKKIENKFGGMVTIHETPLFVIKLSDYNKLMKFYGKDELQLNDAEYGLVANHDEFTKYYNELLKTRRTVTISGTYLTPNDTSCIDVPLENSNMKAEMGTFVIPDAVFTSHPDSFREGTTRAYGNYVSGDTEKIEEDFLGRLQAVYKKGDKKPYPYEVSFTKEEMKSSQMGTTASFTFIGLYLGIIFSITSAAILAIGQLSESADNKERYGILRKLGVDNKMINMSLLLQIGIYFILPLLVAVVHSVVGLREVSRVISIFGNMQLDKNIAITALFLVIIYGAYFIATYIGSKGIIKEKEKYIG